ncbi:MAG: hypothetical protein ACE5E1_07950, partial [Phycisphaerae bacterium]
MRDVAYVDLVLLVKNARRAFRAKVEGLPERSARYHPPALAGMRGIVHLTLRRGGAVLAEAESGEMDVVDASVAAGALLGQAVISKGLACERGGDGWGLELEWLGPQEPIVCRFYDEGGRWSDALLHAFEPAAEGIGVAFRGRRGWTRPSEVISRGYTPDLALAAAEKAIGLRHTQKVRFAKEIRYFRFRARHLWQPDARALPIVLVRGDALVEPEAVTPTGLDAAIDRMGRYLHYRQNRNGEFSHEYVCSGDRYHPGNSARVQLRALIGLADFAAWSGRAEVRADALKGVDRFSTFLRPLTLYAVDEAGRATTRPAGLALAPAGHSHRLEISAALLSALAMVRPESADDERYRGLVAGILSAQREDGAIVLAVEAGTDPAASDPRDVAA